MSLALEFGNYCVVLGGLRVFISLLNDRLKVVLGAHISVQVQLVQDLFACVFHFILALGQVKL